MAGAELLAAREAEASRAIRQKGDELTIEDMERIDRLLTAGELGAFLGVPVATLYAWRYRGKGPAGLGPSKPIVSVTSEPRLGLAMFRSPG